LPAKFAKAEEKAGGINEEERRKKGKCKTKTKV
jgi:hypothetical protein